LEKLNLPEIGGAVSGKGNGCQFSGNLNLDGRLQREKNLHSESVHDRQSGYKC
jgi:hypothetical protein